MREINSKKEVKRNFLSNFILINLSFHKYKETIHKLLLITLMRFTLIKKISFNLAKPLRENFKSISY